MGAAVTAESAMPAVPEDALITLPVIGAALISVLEFVALLPELSELALERIGKRIILAAGRINIITTVLSDAANLIPFGSSRLGALPSLLAMFARTGHVQITTETRIMEIITIVLSQMVMHSVACAHKIMTLNAPAASDMQATKPAGMLLEQQITERSMHTILVAPVAEMNIVTYKLTKVTCATSMSLKDVIAIMHTALTAH